MDVSMIQSPSKRQKELQKLAVSVEDARNYKDIFDLLKEQRQSRKIDVVLFEKLEDLQGDWADLTFFCGEFHSPLYNRLTKAGENGAEKENGEKNANLIVGPAVLRHRLQTNQEMMSLRPCRPLYCELMKNVTMKLSSEVTAKRELVEMVHFMGGSVRKDTIQRTNVLIAGKAAGKFSTFIDIPILRSGWVHECWKHRDNPYYDVFDTKLLAKYKLRVFEGLCLYFHGFKKQDIDDMVKSLKDSEGIVADRIEQATHVVYNSSYEENAESGSGSGEEPQRFLPNIPNQMHVTQEWYWVSLHRGSCAFEENFALPTKTLRRKFAQEDKEINSASTPLSNRNSTNTANPRSGLSKSVSSMRDCSGEGPSLNATPDYIYSNDDMEKVCKSPRVVSKRLQVCMEMVETETNYVNQMKLIVKLKNSLEQEIAQNEFMKKSDVAMIFGKLEPILEVHQKILNNLNTLLNEATSILSTCQGKKTDDKNLDFAANMKKWKDLGESMFACSLNIFKKHSDLLRLPIERRAENILITIRENLRILKEALGKSARSSIFDNFNLLAATLSGVSVKTMTTLPKFEEVPLPSPKHIVKTKRQKQREAAAKTSESVKREIATFLQESWKNQTRVTLGIVLDHIHKKTDFRYGKYVLGYVLGGMGYVFKKKQRNTIIEERPDIIQWRKNFLIEIEKIRDKDGYLVYADETWGFNAMVEIYAWQFGHGDMYQKARMADLDAPIQGPPKGKERGKRCIVLGLLTEDGILPGSEEIIISGNKVQSEDYHQDMDSAKLEQYMHRVIPLVAAAAAAKNREAYLVADNAPYHNRMREKPPISSNTVGEIKDFLNKWNVDFDSSLKKPELLELSRKFVRENGGRQRFIVYELDFWAWEMHKVRIIRTPPYHCFLNAIELFWSQLKGNARSLGTLECTVETVRLRMLDFMKKFTPEQSQKLFNKVKREEDDLRALIEKKKQKDLLDMPTLEMDSDGELPDAFFDSDEDEDDDMDDMPVLDRS
ncbi:unnamed protein product [Caenorhabditis angaria]|uniref:Uncharacterized protein n=1 Tax=Caenorhabditis angaria TaxID=860376 RepID=A0A9P1IED8_9PELO|nr:unnamed protein product [Caenorhabditis angaria]